MAVDSLQKAGLLLRREFSAIETYAFKHALVQETAYASMLRTERPPLHRRIADTLASKFVDVAEGAPESRCLSLYAGTRNYPGDQLLAESRPTSEQAVGVDGSDDAY